MMDGITMEQVLEAYNLIREYCSSHDSCHDCFFVEEHGGFCGFDSGGFNDSVPGNWSDLDLD